MSTASGFCVQKRRPARKLLCIVLLALAALGGIVGLYATIFAYQDWRARRDWQEACADADHLDPGWRWNDLVAAMPVVPADRNSITHIVAAEKLLPSPWPDRSKDNAVWTLLESGEISPPNRRLPPQTATELAAMLDSIGPAVTEGRAIADCPLGRGAVPTSPLIVGQNRSQVVDLPVGFAVAGNLLSPQLVHQADSGDLEGALDTVRAIIHTSRPFTDNLFVVSAVCGCRWRAFAAWGVERTLAQGEPSASALERIRQLFDEEVSRPILLGVFRRERAWVEDLVQAVDDDKVSGQQAALAMKGMRSWTGWAGMDAWIHRMSVPRSEYVALLRHLTWVVERLKESPDALQTRAAEWAALRRQLPEAAKWRADADSGFIEGMRDDEALFRAASVAVAAEQFRRVEGRWPAALDELVPEYVMKVRRDPFDLQPLRLVRRDDGIVIYSVGPNGVDDGGDVVPGAGLGKTRGRDIGIRLWDVAKRRQPPVPPAPSEKGK